MMKIALLCTLLLSIVAQASEPAAKTRMQQLKDKYPSRVFQEVQLPSGRTHYQLTGNRAGRVVVLIHGVSGPMAVWDHTVEALTTAGFQVLRFDLFGRGLSDRIDGSPYALSTFIRQIEELLAALAIKGDVYIVGSSFGAIIGTEFARLHPGRLKGIAFIGPAGFSIKTPCIAGLGDLPIVGELATQAFGYQTIVNQNDKYFVAGRMPHDIRPYVLDQLGVKGTVNAIVATMKNAPVQNYVHSYQLLERLNIPTAVIWGKKDSTFPYSNHKRLLEALPSAKMLTVENSAHLPQYERPQEVGKYLVAFLKSIEERVEDRSHTEAANSIVNRT